MGGDDAQRWHHQRCVQRGERIGCLGFLRFADGRLTLGTAPLVLELLWRWGGRCCRGQNRELGRCNSVLLGWAGVSSDGDGSSSMLWRMGGSALKPLIVNDGGGNKVEDRVEREFSFFFFFFRIQIRVFEWVSDLGLGSLVQWLS